VFKVLFLLQIRCWTTQQTLMTFYCLVRGWVKPRNGELFWFHAI